METFKCSFCKKDIEIRITADGYINCEHCGSRQKMPDLEMQQSKQESNYESKRLSIKKIGSFSIFVIFAALILFFIIRLVLAPMNHYNKAVKMIQDENYIEAYESLRAMDYGYKDCAEKADSIVDEYVAAQIDNAKIGESIFFGHYEQDEESSGDEVIEWIVLDKQGDQALVVSKFILDAQPFTNFHGFYTWEDCSLRSWLGGFLDSAFLPKEQEVIATVTVPADDNRMSDEYPANDTHDKIFILSAKEVERYNVDLNCLSTKYAEEQGAFPPTPADTYVEWWLRMSGDLDNRAPFVNTNGYIDNSGYSMTNHNGVRPAMWLIIK